MSERDTSERAVIISSDSHAGASLRGYLDYLPAKWHEEFESWASAYESPWDDLVRDTAERNWDSQRRLSDLEADGIAAEVLFPNTIPPFFESIVNIVTLPGDAASYERRWAGLQAHNRWLVEFCEDAPDQRRGLVQVFPNDVEAAVEEIRWAAEHPVIGGIVMPAIPANHVCEPYYTDRYHPIWAACAEAQLSVGHHSGSGLPELPDHPATGAVMLTEFSSFAARTPAHLILGGVFEKFPGLKFVMTEQSAMPNVTHLDFMFIGARTRPWLKMYMEGSMSLLKKLPSEYFAQNCYIGSSPGGPVGRVEEARSVGWGRYMWGADYPHREATSPNSREALRMLVPQLTDAETRSLLSEVAAEVYRFDLDKLQRVADRIGPTFEELRTPLTAADWPQDNEWFLDKAAGIEVSA